MHYTNYYLAITYYIFKIVYVCIYVYNIYIYIYIVIMCIYIYICTSNIGFPRSKKARPQPLRQWSSIPALRQVGDGPRGAVGVAEGPGGNLPHAAMGLGPIWRLWGWLWFYMILCVILYDFIWFYNILMMYTAVLVGEFCDILMITQHFWLGLLSGNQTWQGEVYYYDYSLFSHWNLNLWGCYVLLNDPTPFLLQNPCLCPFMMAIPPEVRSVWVGSQSYHLQWRCSEAPMHINYPDSLST